MFRRIDRCRLVFVGMAVLAFLMAIPLDHAMAALVDTQSSQTEDRPDQIRKQIQLLLAREEIRAGLLQHGVNPNEVEARVLALTDNELLQIGDKLGDLPAGGTMAVAIPFWAGVLIVLGLVLVISLLVTLGVWTGLKIAESNEAESAKTPPVPMLRIPSSPMVNPAEIWTGKWKSADGIAAGTWSFKQHGNKVVSTAESDFVVEAKVAGAMIIGTYSEKGGRGKGNFSATIAEDGLSFVADADYWPRVHFTAKKIE